MIDNIMDHQDLKKPIMNDAQHKFVYKEWTVSERADL